MLYNELMIYCCQAALSSPPAASPTSSSWGSWRSWSSPTARAPARSWSDTWERTSPPPLWWSEPVSRVTCDKRTCAKCYVTSLWNFQQKKVISILLIWSFVTPTRERDEAIWIIKATEIQYSFWNNISLKLISCFLRKKT